MVTFDVLTATVHVFSTPHHSTLPQTLREMDLTTLRPFAPGEPQNFAKFLDKVVGLVWSLSDFELWVNFFNRTICAGPSGLWCLRSKYMQYNGCKKILQKWLWCSNCYAMLSCFWHVICVKIWKVHNKILFFNICIIANVQFQMTVLVKYFLQFIESVFSSPMLSAINWQWKGQVVYIHYIYIEPEVVKETRCDEHPV